MSLRTNSYTKITISPAAWDEIAAKLQAAGLDEAILFRPDDTIMLDMGGIGLVKLPTTPGEAIRKGFE